MKIEDIIVHSKKWVVKNNHTEVEGLVYMLKYEYDER